jgi:D-lactate dehydrogenase
MIDAAALAKLPAGAIVVNTARGGIVDSQALIEALARGHLGGAALDVLEGESDIAEEAELISSAYDVDKLRGIVRNHALLRMPNVIITPHVAFNSDQALARIIDTTIDNIHAFLDGRPENVVSDVHHEAMA